MPIIDLIGNLGQGKVAAKLASLLKVCPEDYLIFDNFLEQDDADNISYTVGMPYSIIEFPLNIRKCFLQEIYRRSQLPEPFNIPRATQLLQEVAISNELSMVYFSDEGENEFNGFSSLLWSYHPGHNKTQQEILDLTHKIYFIMFGKAPNYGQLPSWLQDYEIGHIGTALRNGKDILKIYIRLTYKQVQPLLERMEISSLHKMAIEFNFLNENPDGKTILFMDLHCGSILRYGFELRPDLFKTVLSFSKRLSIPENIATSVKSMQNLCNENSLTLKHDKEQFRLHHLKICFTPDINCRWKAYYAYSVED